MNALTEQLEGPQLALLNIIWPLFDEFHQFPVFNYVDHQMRKQGLDARQVISSLPSIRMNGPGTRYGTVWIQQSGEFIPMDSPVCLTIAGLYHIKNDRSMAIVTATLAYLRAMSTAQEQIRNHPFKVPDVGVRLSSSLQAAGIGEEVVPWVAAIAERPWPSMRVRWAGESTEILSAK